MPFMANTSASVCLSLASTIALALHFVLEAFGEQRANRAIHQPRGERFLGRRATFALDEAAGELAGRRDALAIIASQREEIDARAAGNRWSPH